MSVIFNLAFILYGVFYLPFLLFKNKLHKGFKERLGFLPKAFNLLDGCIWIHAVSVGEAAIAAKLLKRIKDDYPGKKVVISTTTATGNKIMTSRGAGLYDALFYFPIDLTFVVNKVINILKPKLFIAVETELWPNLIRSLGRNGAKSVLVNGRLSHKSFSNYMKAGFLVRDIVSNIDILSMQTDDDAARIKKLGAALDRVFVTGNIKFDCEEDDINKGLYQAEKLGFSSGDSVIAAGSTHHPEEKIILEIYRELKREITGLRLILAPRHIDRVPSIESYIKKYRFSYSNFTDVTRNNQSKKNAIDIVLVDTIGDLKYLYSLATVVFIGGSLMKRGGQNPIEAARYGKTVIFGPNMDNFKQIAAIFTGKGAAISVKNKEELKSAIKEILTNESKRKDMEYKALRLLNENKGAITRTMEILSPLIKA